MEKLLDGRVVLVTGSSRGIGAEVAVKAAAEGARVAIHYNTSREGAQRTLARVQEAGGDGAVFSADMADGEQAERLVRQAIDHFGRLDGLVNNAGRTHVGPFLELSPEEWQAVIATDLSAAFHTCRAAFPRMLEQGSGAVVNICSRLAHMGVTQTAAYSAAKAGLIGLTRSLAQEFAGRGIRVNAVSPGFTITEMTEDLAASEEGRKRLAILPLGRFAMPDEIADSVIFLLSDRAALYIGQTLNPNSGGYMP
jgi:3-oxoacyl-[acyl-carrier protein] reductase